MNAVEKEYIIANYGKIQARIIADNMKIPVGTIHTFAKRNNLKKEKRIYNTGRNWTEQDVQYLIDNWKESSVSDLMQALDRTKWSLCSKKLELKKSGRI